MDIDCDFTLQRGDFALRAALTVPAGASLALIGPSGAGKSLFLSALCGFEAVTGRIAMGGRDMNGVAPEARPVSIVFQSHNLFGHLSVFDNVALGRHPGLRLAAGDREDVEAALAAVDLGGFGARMPETLSGGQASRVALARVLVRARPVLLLDEPFAALGPGLRRDMAALVMRMQAERAMTLIYVTHAPDEARAATLTSFVEAGLVHPPRPTGALFDDPPEGLAAYL